MNRRKLVTILVLLLLWQIAAMAVNRPVIIPYPGEVGRIMIADLSDSSFYAAIVSTVGRMLKGLAAAFAAAFVLGTVSGMNRKFEQYFDVINNIIKTIPNVSYIILILIWLGSERSVTVITMFVLFPPLYSGILTGMKNVPKGIMDMSRLEKMDFWTRLTVVHWPFMFPEMVASLKVAFGMGFKVSIMAEILGAVRLGVGREMAIARTYVETGEIFAWTIWIILISLAIDGLFDVLIARIVPEKEGN